MFEASWRKSLPIGIESKTVYYQTLQELIETLGPVAICECPSIVYPIIWFFDGFESTKVLEIEGAYVAGTAHNTTFIVTPELLDEIILKNLKSEVIGRIKILF
jgi:hypothetical protein